MSLAVDRLAVFSRAPASPAAWRALVRPGLVVTGWALIVASPFIGAIPGPGGIPVFVGGLVLVLRNSAGARKLFVRLQRRHPKVLLPVRRLLKRDAKVIPDSWKRALKLA